MDQTHHLSGLLMFCEVLTQQSFDPEAGIFQD